MQKIAEASEQLSELNEKLAVQKVAVTEKTAACEAMLEEIATGMIFLVNWLICHHCGAQNDIIRYMMGAKDSSVQLKIMQFINFRY